MKKQHYPWAFVITFQAPGTAYRELGGREKKGAFVCVLNYLNMQNISQRDQGDSGEWQKGLIMPYLLNAH